MHYGNFLLVSNKYDEVKKQMISDFGITSITDVEVNNMKSFGDYIRQFEKLCKRQKLAVSILVFFC